MYSSNFIAGFGAPGSGKTLDDFLNFIQLNSPLLASLLVSFKDGTITVSGKGEKLETGTATIGNTIYVDPSLLPNGQKALSFGMLADALAHELGHALLPDGESDEAAALNPTEAIQLGQKAEGSAVTAEFLVSQQLLAAGVPGFLAPDGKPEEYSDRSGGLASSLVGALGNLKASDFTNLDSIKSHSDFLTAAESIGGAYYTNQRPSANPTITYQTSWVSTWFLETQFVESVAQRVSEVCADELMRRTLKDFARNASLISGARMLDGICNDNPTLPALQKYSESHTAIQ